jgi:hypothetical protein
MPVIDNATIPQFSIFPRPVAVARLVTVYNYCHYDLWVQPVVGENVVKVERIPAGENLPFPIASDNAAVSLKVSKLDKSFAKPVQIEYSGKEGKVWYDLSLVDCLGTTTELENGTHLRNGDTSACAGHEAGLQLGNDRAMSFQCGSGAWCDDQAYFYEVGWP